MATKQKTKASKPISIDVEKRTVEVVMTTNDVDRDRDIVETKGLCTKNFLQNPVVLWAHNASILPIGKILDIQQSDTCMVGTVEFAKTAMAEEIFQLYVGGFLKTWSIGFDSKKMEFIKNEQNDIVGYHFIETELYELSAVPVPANPEAMVRACKSLKDEELKAVLFKAADYDESPAIGQIVLGEEAQLLLPEAEGALKAADFSRLGEGVFHKTVKEAGASGKVIIKGLEVGENPGTTICFEIVKQAEDGKITEAKVTEITIVLPQVKEAPAPLTPEEPSRTGEETTAGEAESTKSAEATADMAMELAAMKKSLLEASLVV